MSLKRHRGATLADYRRHFGGTPYELWRRDGLHLMDVAALIDGLPEDSAIIRAWGEVDSAPTKQVMAAPPASAPGVDVTVQHIGASEGFDSFDDARDWYLALHPEMTGRV